MALIVTFAGEYDLSRRDEVREILSQVDGTCPVILDVREVRYADSSFFHELSRLKATHPNCEIVISGASASINKILTLLSFDALFTLA